MKESCPYKDICKLHRVRAERGLLLLPLMLFTYCEYDNYAKCQRFNNIKNNQIFSERMLPNGKYTKNKHIIKVLPKYTKILILEDNHFYRCLLVNRLLISFNGIRITEESRMNKAILNNIENQHYDIIFINHNIFKEYEKHFINSSFYLFINVYNYLSEEEKPIGNKLYYFPRFFGPEKAIKYLKKTLYS